MVPKERKELEPDPDPDPDPDPVRQGKVIQNFRMTNTEKFGLGRVGKKKNQGLEIPLFLTWMKKGKVWKKVLDQVPYSKEILESHLQIQNPKPHMVEFSCQELIDYPKPHMVELSCQELIDGLYQNCPEPPKKGAPNPDPKRGYQADSAVHKAAMINSFVQITRGEETSLVEALLDGPIAAQIDVRKEFTKYKEGIFSAPRPQLVSVTMVFWFTDVDDGFCAT